MEMNELIALQQRLSKRFGNVDVYRKEGKGILVVPAGFELNPFNVICVIPEKDI